MFLGYINKCETIALRHGQVKSHIIVIESREFRAVQILFKTFDVESDTDMDHPLTAGTIGLHCASNYPCAYPNSAISSYFALIKIIGVADLGISVGKELTTSLIARLLSTDLGIVPEEEPFVFAC